MANIKYLIWLLSPLLSLALQGQETGAAKLMVGINVSPDYSYRALFNKAGNAAGNFARTARNNNEQAVPGWTAGVDLVVQIARHAALETGIQYSGKGFRTKDQPLIYGQPDPTSPGWVYNRYSYRYIGIPLQAKVAFGRGRLHVLTGIGFMTSLLVKSDATTHFVYSGNRPEKKVGSTAPGRRTVDLSPLLSAGLDYKPAPRIRVAVEPTFRYGILGTRSAQLSEHLWSAGLNTAFYYSLR